MNILEMRAKRAKIWEQAKAFLDSKRTPEGLLSAEDTEAYERMENDVVALGREIERLERQDVIDKELARAVNAPLVDKPLTTSNAQKQGRASNEYKASFWSAMRNRFTPEVYNTLSIGVQTEGGYLVPDEFEATLIAALNEENIVRKIANVIPSSSGEKKIPVVASTGEAQWTDENADYHEEDDTFGVVTLSAHKLTTMLKVSEELLNDSVFNLETYIAKEFARRISRAEEKAFLIGAGTNKPTGIFTSGQTGATTGTATIAADDIIDLYHSLREPYRGKASFLLNDLTVKAIRKLKDNQGQYLWQPGLQLGQPDTILGKVLKTSSFIPEIGNGNKVIAFGDYSFYWIADRVGRTFKRLNEKYADKGQIGFLASQRVDGKLTLPEAVKVLQIKE